MVTMRDILTTGGRYLERDDYATDDVRKNAYDLAERVSRLLESFGEKRVVTSGFRPKHVNAVTPGAAEHSLHIVGAAVDLEDDDVARTGDAVPARGAAGAGAEVIEKQVGSDGADAGPGWIGDQVGERLIDQAAVAPMDGLSEGFAAVAQGVP